MTSSPRCVRALGAILVLVVACAPPRLEGPGQTVSSHPRALDRYARMLRRQLTDPDPVAVQQELSCEFVRVADALGGDEAARRIAGVEDSTWRSAAELQRHAEVEGRLAMKSFEIGSPLCDSLNAIATREDPIAPVDSSNSRR